MPTIVEATSSTHLDEVRKLFEEYADSLGIDLGFQNFAAELAELPGDYASPGGILLLALEEGIALGCVAVRALDTPEIAELKRLYVRPAGRGKKLGEALSQAAIDFVRRAGYRRLRLDTLPSMDAARRLYAGLGFREIPPYRFNPIPGTAYLELDLFSRD